MKIFILGLPKSGCTTVAKSISDIDNFFYIDALSQAKMWFMDKFPNGEFRGDDYHNTMIDSLKFNRFYIDFISEVIASYPNETPVIDGLFSTRDFSYLFDPENDIVVFLNRLDNNTEIKEYEEISLSVNRDYCFWLSSTGLLKKDRWLEFNFRLNNNNDRVRILGSKNTVYVVSNIEKVILVMKSILCKELTNEVSG